MFIDYFFIAWQNLKGKKLRSWLTLLGILIGIAAVVALIGLGDSLRSAVVSQFQGAGAVDVITVQGGGLTGQGPPGTGVVNPLKENYIPLLERISGVQLVVGRIIPTLRIEYNDRVRFSFTASMPSGEKRTFVEQNTNLQIAQGRLLRDDDRYAVVIGHNIAQRDNAFGKAIVVGSRILIENESFRVVGILERKGSFIIDGSILVNEDILREVSNKGDVVDILAVQVQDINRIPAIVAQIERVLQRERGVRADNQDFEVQTPEAALRNLDTILVGIQVFIGVIAGISIFVGSIGIINTMLTSVMERKSQIGIMKSIGAKNSDIFFMFLIESGMMGAIGGLIGIIIGTIIAFVGTGFLVNFLGADTSFTIRWLLLLMVFVGSFLLGAIAGVIPALKAAWEKPVDALRG
ncbi:MAG: ABC transporter permease [Candidatus Woesearchaeota archaeon]